MGTQALATLAKALFPHFKVKREIVVQQAWKGRMCSHFQVDGLSYQSHQYSDIDDYILHWHRHSGRQVLCLALMHLCHTPVSSIQLLE